MVISNFWELLEKAPIGERAQTSGLLSLYLGGLMLCLTLLLLSFVPAYASGGGAGSDTVRASMLTSTQASVQTPKQTPDSNALEVDDTFSQGGSDTASSTPACTLPDWKEIMEAKVDTFQERELQLSSAYIAFMAQVYPALIAAGWGDADDPAPEYYGTYQSYESWEYTLRTHRGLTLIVLKLWSLAVFPEISERLLTGLLDPSLSFKARRQRFDDTYKNIADSLACLPYEKNWQWWYYGGWVPKDHYRRADNPTPVSDEEKEMYWNQIAMVKAWFPLLLDGYDEEASPSFIAKMESLGFSYYMPWGHSCGECFFPYSRKRSFANAFEAAWENRTDARLLSEMKKVFKDDSMPFQERSFVATILADFPQKSTDEILAVLPLLKGLSSLSSCWDQTFKQRYLAMGIGGCDGPSLEGFSKRGMQAQQLVVGSDGQNIQSSIDVQKLSSLQAKQLPRKGLYAVVLNSSVLRRHELKPTKAYPIFSREELSFLTLGPLLIPLDLQQETDKKIVDLCLEKKFPQGGCVFIASQKPVESILQSLESWFILLWQNKEADAEAEFVLQFGTNGNYLKGLFENLEGQAAALAMGGIESVWFNAIGIEMDTWYKASSRSRLPALKVSGQTPILSLHPKMLDEIHDEYAFAMEVKEVIASGKYPEDQRGKIAVFIRSLEPLIEEFFPKIEYYQKDTINAVLWAVQGLKAEEQVRAMFFTKERETSLNRIADKAWELIKAEQQAQKEGEGKNDE